MPSTTGRGRRKTGPSIQDVARLAGVSAQTVSRVSTGANPVREQTRAKVVAAMDQLGYTPNKAARALRNGRFGAIGLLAFGFERTGEALTTEAIVRAADAEDYSVTLMAVKGTVANQWESAAQRLSHQAVDGLIIIHNEDVDESLSLPLGMPVAVSDTRLLGHYPSVVGDQLQGSEDAVRHLLDLGHRAIHHIAGPVGSQPAKIRASTWQRTMEQAGLRPPQLWRGDWSAKSGYEVGRHIAQDLSITAVYCANDEMAFGLMRALQEAGRRVPHDVSIVGFDNIALSEFASPALTTVRQDFAQAGRELVRLVLDQIRQPGAVADERVLIPADLIVRASTAPPPQGR